MLALRCVANGASLERAKRSLWSQADLQVPAVPRVQLLYGRTWIRAADVGALHHCSSSPLKASGPTRLPTRRPDDIFVTCSICWAVAPGEQAVWAGYVPPRVVRTLAIICDG